MSILEYYNNLEIRSYNALINFTGGGRSIGKTTAWKNTALRAYNKDGVMTIWVRRTEEQTKATKQSIASFITPTVQKLSGVDIDDLRIEGNYCKVRDGKNWRNVIKFCSLSTARKERSIEEKNPKFMVFDEYTTTPEEYALFRGNEVRALIDLFITKKRETGLRLFCLGNSEYILNPYFEYFGIPTIDGIHTFKNRSICVENSPLIAKNMGGQIADALAGTEYGEFLQTNADCTGWHILPRPDNCNIYATFGIKGQYLNAHSFNGGLWFSVGKPRGLIFSDDTEIIKKVSCISLRDNIRMLGYYKNCRKFNRIFFENTKSNALYRFLP